MVKMSNGLVLAGGAKGEAAGYVHAMGCATVASVGGTGECHRHWQVDW